MSIRTEQRLRQQFEMKLPLSLRVALMTKLCPRFRACRIIANVMTNRQFMLGMFGDDSYEFKVEQAFALYRLPEGDKDTPHTRQWWEQHNIFNMARYCHIPRLVIEQALGCCTAEPWHYEK